MPQQMLISEESSNRITSLRFILMALVICIHNTLTADGMAYLGIAFDEPAYSFWIKRLFSLGICQAAVPVFFFFSAYLMAKKNDPYLVSLKKKGRSLALPYMLWSFLYIGLFAAFQHLPFTRQFFLNSDNMMHPESIIWWLGVLFGVYRDHPLVYQFWFLRDLMILILAYPVLHFVVRYAAWVLLAVIAGYFLLDFPVPLFGNPSVFFFVVGVICGYKDVDFFKLADKCSWLWLLPLFMVTVVLANLKIDFVIGSFQVVICTSFLILLKLSKILVAKQKCLNLLKMLAPVTFFMYALHEPILMGLLKKLYIKAIPMQGVLCLVEYVLVCVVGIAVSTAVALLFKRILPRCFAVLSGGRK